MSKLNILAAALKLLISLFFGLLLSVPVMATTFTETVPNGNGVIPNTFPPVGGTMFVLIGANGNIYYQFVNPSTQFRGFGGTGTPADFQGIPTFQLGPSQVLNCGIVSCNDYFGGSIVEGYTRLTVRDADACPGNFDFNDVSFEVNGLPVASLSNLAPNSVERTNFAGTTTIGTEDCFRNQGGTETSTAWFDLPGNVLNNILSVGSTTPFITDTDTGSNTTRGDNFWFFTDGNDATGTPEVAPGVEITKTADRTSYNAVGDVINYSFEVRNIGSVQLNSVVVTDSFITGTVNCPQNSLTSGETMICTGQHIVSQADIDQDIVFVNTAEVTANPTEGALGAVSGTLTIPGPDADNSATITKTASVDTNLNVGDVVTYTYVVQNTGNITLNDLSISDAHGGSGALSAVTPANISLAPGASQSFTATYTVTQDDFDAGQIDNTASIIATPVRGSFTSPTADEQVTMATPTPEATFSKLASPDSDVSAGDVITYTYRAENTGDVTLSNVTITDVHNGNGPLGAITPASATIAPGDFVEFTASYTVLQSDVDANAPITNTATASFTPERGTLADLTDDASVGVAAEPSAVFTKTASPDSDLRTGDLVTYSYVVENTGNVDLINLSVSDIHSGIGTLSAITPASLSVLAAGESTTFTATYTVTLDDFEDGSNITNEATLNFTPERGTLAPLTADEIVTIAGPVPAAALTKTASQTTGLQAGDVVTYTYNVENTGDVSLNDVSITDVHPGAGTLSAITPSTVATLAIGDNVDFTATYEVTQDDIDAGLDITNTATLAATPMRGVLPSTTADETIAIEAADPVMTLEKTASITADAAAGDVITYSYLAVNTGNITMTNVSISDVHNGTGSLSAITPASVDLAPGESQTFTATYEVTQDDIDAGVPITNDATLGGTPERGTYTPAIDDASVSVITAAPSMSLEKTADRTANLTVGETVTYTYSVENTGNVTFDNVSITDVHNGAGVLSAVSPGLINNFAPGDIATFTATYVIEQEDLDAAVAITNEATLGGTPRLGAYTPVTDTESVSLIAPDPQLSLVKTATPTANVALGDVITYSYVVENTGNVTMENVMISDVQIAQGTLSAISPANVTSLAPGATASFTATYEVLQADVDSGADITNTATVDAVPLAGSFTPVSDDAVVTQADVTPAVDLTKTADVTTGLSVGDVVTYTYSAENTGDVTLTNVSVSDVHNGAGALSAITPPSFATVAVGQTVTFTANYEVTQADIDAGVPITNEATLSATPERGTLAPVTADESVTVDDALPSLSLDKRALTTDFTAVGDVLSYEYEVENTGNVTIANLVVGDDRIAVVTCPVTTLAPGEVTVCTATYEVTQDDLNAGSVVNIATASGDPAAGTLDPAEDTETVEGEQTPALTVEKTALDTVFAAVGDVLAYEYLVTNTGNVTVIDPISVSDDRISSVSCPALPAGGLAPTASLTCTASYVVTQADIDAGEVVNIASASDGNVTSPTDSAVASANQTPDLSIVKTAQQTSFTAVGDSLTYDYVVTNTGNVTLNGNIMVDDDRIAAVSCPALPASGLAPNASITCSASYIVTQADIDVGSVTNIASARNGDTVSPSDDAVVNADQQPALDIVKRALDTTYSTVGEQIGYEYDVINIGNTTLTNPITVSDDRIASVSCPALPAGGLAPGGSITCSGVYSVTQQDIDDGVVENIASATDGNVTSPVVNRRVFATRNSELEIEKNAVDVNFTLPGDIVTYEYIVTNRGNITIIDPITVDDNLIANVTCPALPAGGLAPNASLTCTAEYVVTLDNLEVGVVVNLATASAGGVTSAPTSATIPDGANPAIEIRKSSLDTSFAAVGDILTYSFEIENTGNVTLVNTIEVVDNRIGTISCFAGPTFIPGQIETCTADYTVTQADLDAGFVTNDAFAMHPRTSSPPDFVTITADQNPELTLVKTAQTPDFAQVGDRIDYVYTVTNTGNITLLQDITVSDNRIANVTCAAMPAGGLAVDASITCTASDFVTQADIDAGFVTNTATATDGSVTSAPVDETVDGVQTPSIDLVKTALNNDFAAVGDRLEYSYTVTNDGNVTITDPVTISDDRIANVVCPALPAGGLQPNASIICTAEDVVTQADLDAGSVTNTASASDGTTTSDPASQTVTGTQSPAIEIAKTSPDSQFAAVGDVLTYNYDVTNTGNVTITDAVSVSDDRIAAVSCPALPAGGLVPGASITCSADYTVVQADIDAGSVTNIADASAGGTVSAPVDLTITADQAPELSLVKTALDTTYTNIGDRIDYEYVVTNTGNVTITRDIDVSDDRISSVNCPALPAGGLAVDASITCTASDVVTQADLDAGFVINTASASDGVTSSDPVSERVNGAQTPELTLAKAALNSDFTAVGDILEYNYVVTNTGNITITDPVSVTDDRIANVVCPALPSGGLLPGTSITCTGEDSVTQADLDAGFVTNIASASDGTTTSDPSSQTVTGTQTPVFIIEKSSNDTSFAAVGDVLTYSYDIFNTGNVTLIEPFTVSDDRIPNVVCDALPAGGLVPGDSLSCAGTDVVTQEDIDNGFVVNTATASDGTQTTPPVTLRINGAQTPALSLVKNALTTEFAAVGDQLSYEYIVTNTGNVTLTEEIIITDDRIAVVSCPALPVGGLVPTASITCTATDVVTQADLDAGFVTNIASASDGTLTTDPMSATVDGTQNAGLEIEKLALTTSFAAIGDELSYSYNVRNTGNVTITAPITVSDDRIADVDCPALPNGGLVPGAVLTCTAVYEVTQADIDAGFVTNIASASDGTSTSPVDDATVQADQLPALEIVKTSPQSSFNGLAQILTYNYEVTNTGNVTLTDPITVSDDRIPNVVCPALPADGLAPNASITCSADYSVTQDNLDSGEVTNIASASTGDVTSDPVSLTIDAVALPELSLEKTALTTNFTAVGDVLSYEYVVTNTGNVTITEPVTVSDDRIASVVCEDLPVGGLLPGQSLSCTAQDVVTQADLDAGFVTNIATASDGTTSSAPADATVDADQVPALGFTKQAQTADFNAVGDILSYVYIVENTGNVTITQPITVSDDRIDTVICPALPADGLAPSETLTCAADYVVTQEDIDLGFVTNVASASDGTTTSPQDDVTIDAVILPALEIVKSSPDTTYAQVGDILTYNYLVTNTGNATLTTPVTVSDDRIADVTCPALPADGLAPAASLTCRGDYAVTQADLDAGEVTNLASASDGTTVSDTVSLTIEGTALPALEVVKTAITESFAMPGDIISYEYLVTNTGNVTLTTPVSINDDKIETVTCPALPASGLAPQASLTCTADYEAVQADLDAGFVTNIASAQSGDTLSDEVSETVEAQRLPAIDVSKIASTPQQVFGPIYDVTYNIELANTGNVTLTDLSLEDDLLDALAPSTLIGTPQVSLSGFTTGAANDNYNGIDDIELLGSNTSLTVGESGNAELRVRIDTTLGGPLQGNTAFGNNPEISTPTPSNDPSVTPDDTNDTNPTLLSILDADGDGAPDDLESGTEDRDGDGIPDRDDFDPTGYFYCEENGNILTGGGITVTGPFGSNSSVGAANNIVILADGSTGFYQFYVTAAGEYTLTPTYPNSGVPSTARLPEADVLDVTSLLPANPAVLGGTELGDSGQLSDFSAEANAPFYTRFTFEEGDPNVFANNLPLQHCGEPAIELTKEAVGDVELTDDGRQQVGYSFTITNTGETLVEDVQLTDNLGNVFGAGNIELVNLSVTDIAPPTQTGIVANPAYNGVTTLDMLLGGGQLTPGQSVTLNMVVNVTPLSDGEAINTAVVSAAEPLNGGPLTANDSAVVELQALSDPNFVTVAKRAQPRTVQIGDPVLYTIDVTNDSASVMTDLRITDRLPEGFAYIPGSAVISDGELSTPAEPLVTGRGLLNWDVLQSAPAPLDTLAAGETLSVSLRLLAGPNVEFGAHENQAFAESLRTGERSDIATAVVDYIPEPSFDCTPVLGRVYDDVNHNGYPDDGEPGLPGVRLVTVNGDIITTDQYGRYHIPCAAIADRERGSNFLLKADVRSLPLGYHPTSENPRVVRATRGKFVKMNFGAAHRPKLRIDLFAADFDDQTSWLESAAQTRVKTLLAAAAQADRAIIIYHADDLENINEAQAHLATALDAVKMAAPKQFKDIALEASWGDAAEFTPPQTDGFENLAIGGLYDRPAVDAPRDRVAFTQGAGGNLQRFEDSDEIYAQGGDSDDDGFNNARSNGLRGQRGSAPLSTDSRGNNSSPFIGRRDQGEAETPRPGRLQRWVGWGGKTTSYAEGLEIETTVDALNPVKRLNAQANVVSTAEGRELRVEAYSNYNAFMTSLELRLFPEGRSVRGEPVAVVPLNGRYGQLDVTADMAGDYSYVLRAYDADGNFDETAQKVLNIGDPEYDLSNDDWAYQASTAFGQNTLLKDNIRVRGGSVRVYGRNVPGETATVMGQNIAVDPQGLFVAEQLLPAGEQSVEVRIAGANGGEQRIIRSVDVKARDTFYAAQIEATIGEDATAEGDSFEQGRVAFYVRSRLNDRWSVTATADTGEADLDNLISGLDDKDLGQLLRRLDPDRFYPTYGDDSTIEQDAPTSGRFYARIERDDDYALWGNYQTNFNDTEFGRVQRTLYGAKFHWDENGNTTKFGDDRTRVTAFIAEGGTRQGRDEFRGTGGSVYYLRQGDISIGSEILRIQTRDSVSGLVIENRRLVYGTDYDLDFIQGRIILNQPLGSTGDDGRLFRDGSQGGNQQILVVDYEFSPVIGSDDGAAVYGARGSRWIGDHIKIGATYNHDTDGGEESDLYGLDLTLQYAAGTYIKGEVARSEGQGVQTFRSVDGGFTFNPQDRGGNGPDNTADAYALEAAVDFTEIDGIKLNGNSFAYWRKRDAGFAGFAESTNQTIEQYGGGLSLALAPRLSVSARADITTERTNGTNSFAEGRVDYQLADRLAASVGLSFTDDARGNSGTSLGGRVDYQLNDSNKVYAFGQVGLEGDNTRTTDRLGAGAEVRLSKHIYGGGEISTGEDGLGARASLRYQYEDGDEFYVAYDLPLRARPTANLGTFNLGARRRYGDALSIFGEERFQFNDRGLNGVTHAYGIDYKPGNWNFGLTGETGRVDDLDRDAFSATVGFAGDRLKAGLTGEWREDENVDTGDERRTWLLRSTALYQASEELRLQGKFNLAVSDQSRPDVNLGPQSFNEAEFREASLSAAYRPIWDDRFNLIGKLVWLEDLSPTSQRFNGETLNYRQKSQIASIDASYDISPKWTLGGKYAYRAGSVTSNRDSLDFTDSQAQLGVIRLDYHLTNRWDALVEGRYLDIGNGVTSRLGGQVGIYRHVNDNAKIGIGLTYGGIEEEYLAAVGREDDIGWYLNIVGKF